MAITAVTNFPAVPTLNQEVDYHGTVYHWDGKAWVGGKAPTYGNATETVKGIVEFASPTEVDTGAKNVALDPEDLKRKLQDYVGKWDSTKQYVKGNECIFKGTTYLYLSNTPSTVGQDPVAANTAAGATPVWKAVGSSSYAQDTAPVAGTFQEKDFWYDTSIGVLFIAIKNAAGNLVWMDADGRTATMTGNMPTDAKGVLTNDGTGTLSWSPADGVSNLGTVDLTKALAAQTPALTTASLTIGAIGHVAANTPASSVHADWTTAGLSEPIEIPKDALLIKDAVGLRWLDSPPDASVLNWKIGTVAKAGYWYNYGNKLWRCITDKITTNPVTGPDWGELPSTANAIVNNPIADQPITGGHKLTNTGDIEAANLKATTDVSTATVTATGLIKTTDNVEANNAKITTDVSTATLTASGEATANSFTTSTFYKHTHNGNILIGYDPTGYYLFAGSGAYDGGVLVGPKAGTSPNFKMGFGGNSPSNVDLIGTGGVSTNCIYNFHDSVYAKSLRVLDNIATTGKQHLFGAATSAHNAGVVEAYPNADQSRLFWGINDIEGSDSSWYGIQLGLGKDGVATATKQCIASQFYLTGSALGKTGGTALSLNMDGDANVQTNAVANMPNQSFIRCVSNIRNTGADTLWHRVDKFSVKGDGSGYFAGGTIVKGSVNVGINGTGSGNTGHGVYLSAGGNIWGRRTSISAGSAMCNLHADTADPNSLFIQCKTNAKTIFRVMGDGRVIALNTAITSDPRLKTNWDTNHTPATLASFRSVNIGKYDWVDDDLPNDQFGFDAASLHSIAPECVSLTDEPAPEHRSLYYDDVEVPDPEDEENHTIESQRNDVPMDDAHKVKAVNIGSTMALMAKLLHEANDRIEALEAEVQALKGTP